MMRCSAGAEMPSGATLDVNEHHPHLILKAVDESNGFFPGRDPDFVFTAERTSELF
jgi:hypothetical protein